MRGNTLKTQSMKSDTLQQMYLREAKGFTITFVGPRKFQEAPTTKQ